VAHDVVDLLEKVLAARLNLSQQRCAIAYRLLDPKLVPKLRVSENPLIEGSDPGQHPAQPDNLCDAQPPLELRLGQQPLVRRHPDVTRQPRPIHTARCQPRDDGVESDRWIGRAAGSRSASGTVCWRF